MFIKVVLLVGAWQRYFSDEDIATPENAENPIISRPEDAPLFGISQSSESKSVSGAVFGFVFTAGGFGATVYTAGPYLGVALSALATYGVYRFNGRFSMTEDTGGTY